MSNMMIGVCLLFLVSSVEAIALNQWSNANIERLLRHAQGIKDQGDRVDFISGYFLNTRYQAHTLIGDASTPERLTVRLDAVDCLTYLEYVEAMRRSQTASAFLEHLKAVRYQAGQVSYATRKHFFSNWLNNPSVIEDVTEKAGFGASLKAKKQLNAAHAKQRVPGIAPFEKIVHYIPSYKIDAAVLSRLKNGDYIGIYTDREGLDVTHVGILIKRASTVYFRHADADAPNRKTVDTGFLSFIKRQRGIVVFRPR